MTIQDKEINETSDRSSCFPNSHYSQNLKSDDTDKHFVHDEDNNQTSGNKDIQTFKEQVNAEDMEANASDSMRSDSSI